jgi:HD-like signal output (HDOD) protein
MNTLKTEPASAKKTMELLWLRMRQRGDLPGFSKAVSSIMGVMRGEGDREVNMTRTVLSDPALTQKVLRLSNSAMYSVFGQGINTVSKAVIVLGTETIAHLALGLKLIDGLSALSGNSSDARSEMEKAVLAAHIARQITFSASARDVEEAVVCAMLHSMGRMMVIFYLSDRWQVIQSHCARTGAGEEAAAHEVLGLGLDEIGRLAGKQWGLPASLINTLKDIAPNVVGEPLDHADWLAAVSTLSSRCANALSAGEAASSKELSGLADGYAEMLGLDVSQVLTAVENAQRTAADEDSVVVRPTKRAEDVKLLEPQQRSGKPADAAMLLTRGVADLRGASRSASISLGQLMAMALETVYQGLGFSRAIVFLRNQEQSQYAARVYFGDGIQELLPRLVFDDAYQPDVFHAALANDKMIFVENARDPSFISKLPRWWKDALPIARSFMVLPLTVNHQAVGCIYGDWDMSVPPAKIEPAEIVPLNELRSLVLRALEQRRQAEPTWARRML